MTIHVPFFQVSTFHKLWTPTIGPTELVNLYIGSAIQGWLAENQSTDGSSQAVFGTLWPSIRAHPRYSRIGRTLFTTRCCRRSLAPRRINLFRADFGCLTRYGRALLHLHRQRVDWLAYEQRLRLASLTNYCTAPAPSPRRNNRIGGLASASPGKPWLDRTDGSKAFHRSDIAPLGREARFTTSTF